MSRVVLAILTWLVATQVAFAAGAGDPGGGFHQGGSVATTDQAYVTIGTSTALEHERALTGSTNILITDSEPTVTVSLQGQVPFANGGSGQATRQAALNAFLNNSPATNQVVYFDGTNWKGLTAPSVNGTCLGLNGSGVFGYFTPAGGGTVTSVGLSMPSFPMTITNSPVTGSGTLTATPNIAAAGAILVSDAANSVIAKAAAANGKFVQYQSGQSGGITGADAVTSVAMTVPTELSVSGTPISTTGTLAVTWNTGSGSKFIGTPAGGGSGTYAGRALVTSDLPAGTGTVTSMSIGPASLFDIATSTTTPAITMDNQNANTVIAGPASGSAAAPAARNLVPTDLYQTIFSGGRVTLESGVPYSTTDQTAKTTVYFTPYGHDGNLISIYDGTRWIPCTFSEISVSPPANTNTPFDIFATQSGGTVSLTATAWTSDTARNGYSITLLNGVPVKSTANTSRLVGMGRTTGSSGQTQQTASSDFCQNVQNLLPRKLYATDGTNSWNYTTATIRAARANTTVGTARTELLTPLPYTMVHAAYTCTCAGDGNTAGIGIAMDSTTARTFAAQEVTSVGSACTTTAAGDFWPAIGYHYIQNTEVGDTTGGTFYGDNGGTPPLTYQTVEYMNDIENVVDFVTRKRLRNSPSDAPEWRAA